MNNFLLILYIEKLVHKLWVASIIIFACLTLYFLSPQFSIHQYRQAQTAITAFYLPLEGFKFNYSTPIMGFPWSVPLEFPLYQWLTVLVQKITGGNLIVSGKMINILGHVINNILIIEIFRRYKLDRIMLFSGLIFYNLFPFYLVFDTVFLVDSFTLTLCFTTIYFLSKFFQTEKKLFNAMMFFLFAFLTGLSKSTIFIGVLFPISAVLLIQQIWNHGFNTRLFNFRMASSRNIFIPGILLVTAIATMYFWVVYTDGIKMQNPLSAQWTSANTRTWNFGTLQQRFFLANWKQYFTYSMLEHPVFYLLFAGGLTAFIFYSDRKEKLWALCLFLFFFTPLLLFFNLFLIHTYYSIANMIFVYFILGLIVSVLIRQKVFIVRTVGIGLGIIFLLFGTYRSYAFRNQIQKNEGEPGPYGQLYKLDFKPGPDDIIVKLQESRDPYLQYYFKCKGINLNKAEYEKYGKKDRLKQLSGGLRIRMVCIVDEQKLEQLPGEYSQILPSIVKHISILDESETNLNYNFFWY